MPKERIAKVILPLALDKEFDYSFDPGTEIKEGMRVLVDFRSKKKIALVVKTTAFSAVKGLKPLIRCLDRSAVLTQEHFQLADDLSQIYPYSKADFLYMMLPQYLKTNRQYSHAAKPIPPLTGLDHESGTGKDKYLLPVYVKSDFFRERYSFWFQAIRENLQKGSVLVCFPQLSYLLKAKEIFDKDFPGLVKVLYSQKKDIFSSWLDSRQNSLILGTRVSLLYYPQDLRLIIIEDEANPYYFQEEKPYHNLFDLALILARMKRIQLIASSDLPSLSAYMMIKDQKMRLEELTDGGRNIEVIEIEKTRSNRVIGPIAQELLRKTIAEQKKTLVVWNKKGFSRFIACTGCKKIIECLHCSGYLISSHEPAQGVCPYCQRSVILPEICPDCKNGYLRSFGFGVEKVSSIIKKMYPMTVISDSHEDLVSSQIIISTSKILNFLYEMQLFDYGLVLDADSQLHRIDYDATFKAFAYFRKLSLLCRHVLYIFTYNKSYYLFQGLGQQWKDFYDQELTMRRKSHLPPFGMVAEITLRCSDKNSLLKKAQRMYNNLKGV
ncbi:MAG: hypothetical protein JW867_09110, partial [Candidatus Omnitrophica bacterium]|nr:hypothetical protein [Candidatus Omnitrophota bacterium]